MKFRTLAAALATLVMGAVPPTRAAAADGPGSLTVTIKDNYGVLPGTAVRLAGKDGQTTARATTDGTGVARFTSLAAGEYTIKASLTGFADAEKAGVMVGATEEKVELVMSLTRFSTTVTVTTANRREELLMNTAEPTTVIDQVQILDTGSRNAKDLLSEQQGSGVQVNVGGGQGYVSLNGVSNKGVLVMIDGRRYLGRDANGNFNLEDLPISGVERVEVVKGAGSALYGSDALGGVVNFITRRPEERGVTNALKLSGGSYGDFRVGDDLTWRGESGGVSLSGGYRTYDGYDLDKTNPQTIGLPASTFWNASGSADWRLAPSLVARVFGDYQLREVRNYFFSGATQLASTVYDSQRDLTRYTLSPELEWTPGSKTSLNATYTYGKYLRDETRVFSVGGRVVPQTPWREWNQEAKLTLRQAWSGLGQDQFFQGGYEYRNEKLSRGSLSVSDPHRDINVLWGQQELNLGDRLKLTAGARWDDYSDFGSEWSPKADAVFTLAKQHRLRASYGHGFRPPYFGELYLSTPPFFVGNPELTPETSDGFTGGYAYAGTKAQLSVDTYYTKVKNGIIFYQLTPSQYTYRNIDRYNSKGVNVQTSLSLPLGFTPSASYAYNKREDPQGADVGGYPTHSAFLKLLWANPRLGLRANVRGQINGKVPPGVDGTFQPAYDVWYAQLSKRFAHLGSHGLNLYAQVDNLFDKKNVFLANPDGTPVQGQFQVWLAPRTFQAGLSLGSDWVR
jgi:outer membrane receptor for ferrienterochelin and colicins